MGFSFLAKWNQPAADRVGDLGWAVRIGFLTITVIFGFLTFWLALLVQLLAFYYEDLFSGTLPAFTEFVMDRPMTWIKTAFAVPAAALVFAILAKRHVVAVAGISLATLVLVVEVFCISLGIGLPLVSFLNVMLPTPP